MLHNSYNVRVRTVFQQSVFQQFRVPFRTKIMLPISALF